MAIVFQATQRCLSLGSGGVPTWVLGAAAPFEPSTIASRDQLVCCGAFVAFASRQGHDEVSNFMTSLVARPRRERITEARLGIRVFFGAKEASRIRVIHAIFSYSQGYSLFDDSQVTALDLHDETRTTAHNHERACRIIGTLDMLTILQCPSPIKHADQK